MKLGCSGIVLKQTAPELIVKSIRKVHSGEIWLDSHTTAAVMRQFASPAEVMTASARQRAGTVAAQPARARDRRPRGAGLQEPRNGGEDVHQRTDRKNHLHNIFDKLGVSDRLELALYAIHKGLHLVDR